jgi:hypothetical protein
MSDRSCGRRWPGMTCRLPWESVCLCRRRSDRAGSSGSRHALSRADLSTGLVGCAAAGPLRQWRFGSSSLSVTIASMPNRESWIPQHDTENVAGRANAEPSLPFRAADRGSEIPILASVALALLLLAGFGYALLVLGGRSRAKARFRRSPGDPGAPRSGRDSLLPAVRSILLPRNHHEALHDPKYLDLILRAELEQENGSEPPGAAEKGAPEPGDADAEPGNSRPSNNPRD